MLFAAPFVVTHAFDTTGLLARLVAGLESHGVTLTSPWLLGPLTIVGSNTIGNVPLVVMHIITVERAQEVGVQLGFLEHARCGIPITVLSLAAALAWLAYAAPSGG